MEYVYEDGIEKMLATKFDHPYDFKILKSEMVGTNDCIVIARIMTELFLEAVWHEEPLWHGKKSP